MTAVKMNSSVKLKHPVFYRYVREKELVMGMRARNESEALQERLHNCLEEISVLSSEYYYLMPKAGFEYVRLNPIDNEHLLAEEVKRVDHTLEFETAERLLLGAQFRKKEINPLDYIYRYN